MIRICENVAHVFETLGIPVLHTSPDFTGFQKHYRTLRAYGFACNLSGLLSSHKGELKPEIVAEIECGLTLTVNDLIAASNAVTEYHQRVEKFFSEFDLLLTPTTIVPPFPAEQRYVTSCAGTNFDNYLDWLVIAYAVSFVALPALSLPCGFTKDHLPVGLQLVGRHRGEADILSFALVLEEFLNIKTDPIIPKKGSIQ